MKRAYLPWQRISLCPLDPQRPWWRSRVWHFSRAERLSQWLGPQLLLTGLGCNFQSFKWNKTQTSQISFLTALKEKSIPTLVLNLITCKSGLCSPNEDFLGWEQTGPHRAPHIWAASSHSGFQHLVSQSLAAQRIFAFALAFQLWGHHFSAFQLSSHYCSDCSSFPGISDER